MPDSNRKPDGEKPDPAQLEEMIELELMQKRAAWQQARAGRRMFRGVAYLFLFLVIAAAIAAFFLFRP